MFFFFFVGNLDLLLESNVESLITVLLSSIVLTEGDEKENEREREKDELNDFNPFQVIIIKN